MFLSNLSLAINRPADVANANPSFSWVAGLSSAPTGSTVAVNFSTDGTNTVNALNGGVLSGLNTVPTNWYSPTTPGIGNSRYVKVTNISGYSLPYTGYYMPISSAPGWGVTKPSKSSRTSNVLVEFSMDGVTSYLAGYLKLTTLSS